MSGICRVVLWITAEEKRTLYYLDGGDDSLLSEDYVNPHYVSSTYCSYGEQTQQNLVRAVAVLMSYFPCQLFQDFIIWNCSIFFTEKIEWRCHWLWSAGRLDLPCWWNIWWRCHIGLFACKSINNAFAAITH